jgi:hypothetical protein
MDNIKIVRIFLTKGDKPIPPNSEHSPNSQRIEDQGCVLI